MWSRKRFSLFLLLISAYVGAIWMSPLPSLEPSTSGQNFTFNSTSNETLMIQNSSFFSGKPSLKRFRLFLVPINSSLLQKLKRVEMPEIEFNGSSSLLLRLNRTEMWLRYKETFEKDVQSYDSYHDVVTIPTDDDDDDEHVATLTDVPAISSVTSSRATLIDVPAIPSVTSSVATLTSSAVALNGTYEEMAPNMNSSKSRSFESVLSASGRVVKWFEDKFPELDLEEPLENVRDHIINQSKEMELDVEQFLDHVFDVLEGSESNGSRFHATARLFARHFSNFTAYPRTDDGSMENATTSTVATEENASRFASMEDLVEGNLEDRQLDFSSEHAATALLRMFEEWLNTTYTQKCSADSTKKDCDLLLKALEKCLKSLDALQLDEDNSTASQRSMDYGYGPVENKESVETTTYLYHVSTYGTSKPYLSTVALHFGRGFRTENGTASIRNLDLGLTDSSEDVDGTENGTAELRNMDLNGTAAVMSTDLSSSDASEALDVNGTRSERDSMKVEQLLAQSLGNDHHTQDVGMEDALGSGQQDMMEATLESDHTERSRGILSSQGALENVTHEDLINKSGRQFGFSDLLLNDTKSGNLNVTEMEDREEFSVVSSATTPAVATTYFTVVATPAYVPYGYGRMFVPEATNGTMDEPDNFTSTETRNNETVSASEELIEWKIPEDVKFNTELNKAEDEMERISELMDFLEKKGIANETDLISDILNGSVILNDTISVQFDQILLLGNVSRARNMDWSYEEAEREREHGGTVSDFDQPKQLASDISSNGGSSDQSGPKGPASNENAEVGMDHFGGRKDQISDDYSRLSNGDDFGHRKDLESDHEEDFHAGTSQKLDEGSYDHLSGHNDEMVHGEAREDVRGTSAHNSDTEMKHDDFGQREENLGIQGGHQDDTGIGSSENVKIGGSDQFRGQTEDESQATHENLRESSSSQNTGMKYDDFGHREGDFGVDDQLAGGSSHEGGKFEELDHRKDFSDLGGDISSMGDTKESQRGSFHEEYTETDSGNREDQEVQDFDVRDKAPSNRTTSWGRSGHFDRNVTNPGVHINSHLPPSLLANFTSSQGAPALLDHIPHGGNETVSEDYDYYFENWHSDDNSTTVMDNIVSVTLVTTGIPLEGSNFTVQNNVTESETNATMSSDDFMEGLVAIEHNLTDSGTNDTVTIDDIVAIVVPDTNTTSVPRLFHEARAFEDNTSSNGNSTTPQSNATKTSLNLTEVSSNDTEQTRNPQDVVPELEDILNENSTTLEADSEEETSTNLATDSDKSTTESEIGHNITMTTLVTESLHKLEGVSDVTEAPDENFTSSESSTQLLREEVTSNSTVVTERNRNETLATHRVEISTEVDDDNTTTSDPLSRNMSDSEEVSTVASLNVTVVTTLLPKTESSSMSASRRDELTTSVSMESNSTTSKSLELTTSVVFVTTAQSNKTELWNVTTPTSDTKLHANLPPFTYDDDDFMDDDDDKEMFVPLEDVATNDTWLSQKYHPYMPSGEKHQESEEYHAYYHKEQSGVQPRPPSPQHHYGQKENPSLVDELNKDIESPEELYNEPLPFRPLNVPTMDVLCQKNTDCNRKLREICIVNGFFSFCDCPLYYQRHPLTAVCVERVEPDPGFLIRARRAASFPAPKFEAHCSERSCSNNGICYKALNNTTVCGCYTWYFGRKCQIDAMVVVICILSGMSALSILALVFSSLYCLRKRSQQGWHPISPY